MQLVGSLLFGAEDAVKAFVSRHTGVDDFGKFTALGIVKNNKIVGGVIYHELRGNTDVRVSIALEPCGFVPWRALFSYAFNHLKVARITAIIEKRNKKSRVLCQRLGFKEEGVHPLAIDGRHTAISYGITRKNCRWIKD